MPTFKTKNGTVFIFDSDFGGKLRIKNDKGEEIEVPADDILQLVATYLASARISKMDEGRIRR